MFLFCFDMFSIFERKNPLAVIEAFTRAFDVNAGPILVIKCINGSHAPQQLEKLRKASRGRSDIILWDGYLNFSRQKALIGTCDAYISLHRAEGFGFTMLEAMSMGKPVIATGYSGNLEFMTETNSCLVPYTLIPVADGNAPYPTSAHWAEPDIDAAASWMVALADDRREGSNLGRRAEAEVQAMHTARARAPAVRASLDALAPGAPWRLSPRVLLEGELARHRLGSPSAAARSASLALAWAGRVRRWWRRMLAR